MKKYNVEGGGNCGPWVPGPALPLRAAGCAYTLQRFLGQQNAHRRNFHRARLAGGFTFDSGIFGSRARNFPTDPGQAVTPGKVDVKGDATITVRSLQSVEKNGSKYKR